MHHVVYEKPAPTTSAVIIEKRVARDILNIIENICYSDEYRDYRIRFGSKGQLDLLIQTIQEKYNVM